LSSQEPLSDSNEIRAWRAEGFDRYPGSNSLTWMSMSGQANEETRSAGFNTIFD